MPGNGDKASRSIILVGQGLLVKCSELLNRMVYVDKFVLPYTFNHCLGTGMQHNDEASP